ncbi:hypothetical protein J7K50_09870 [bacterium]|nr:hypothetical protein [bacterium]
MKKIVFAFLLSAVLMLSILPLNAEPDSSEKSSFENRIVRGWITLERVETKEDVRSFHFRVIEGKVQHIKFSENNDVFEFFIIGMPLKSFADFPRMDESLKWVGGADGQGLESKIAVYVRQIEDGESWILITEEDERIPLVALPGSDEKIGYEIKMKLEGMWDRKAYAECIPNNHIEMYYANDPSFVIIGPGDSWDSVFDDLKGRVWVKVPIPAEFGEFYGISRAVGEVWTVTIHGVEYSATATEADPDFDVDSFMNRKVKPRELEE